MKKRLTIGTLVIFSLLNLYCEKDDICSEEFPTTPSIVVEVFNSLNPSVPRVIPILEIQVEGYETQAFLNTSSFKLPLKNLENVTQFNLTVIEGENRNTDVLTIEYEREKIFISRACGYRNQFRLPSLNAIQVVDDEVNWIQDMNLNTQLISDENEVHLKLFY